MQCNNCGATLAEGQTCCPVCVISDTKSAHSDIHCMKCGRLLPANATMCPICDAHQPPDPLTTPVAPTTIASPAPRPAPVRPAVVEQLVSCPHCHRLSPRGAERCPACGIEFSSLHATAVASRVPLNILAQRVASELWIEPVTGLARVATVLRPERILALGVIALVATYALLLGAELLAANDLFHLVFRSASPSVSLADIRYSTPPLSRDGSYILQGVAPLLPLATLASLLFFVRRDRPARAETDLFVTGIVLLPGALILLLFAGISLILPSLFTLGAYLGGSISTVMLYGALHGRYQLVEQRALALALLLISLTGLISTLVVVFLLRMLFSWNW